MSAAPARPGPAAGRDPDDTDYQTGERSPVFHPARVTRPAADPDLRCARPPVQPALPGHDRTKIRVFPHSIPPGLLQNYDEPEKDTRCSGEYAKEAPLIDARQHRRIACRLPLDVRFGQDGNPRQCRTADIGLGGLFVTGLTPVLANTPVNVGLGPEGFGELRLNSRVAHVRPDGAGLAFVDNSPSTLEMLAALLEPVWDGGTLLDDVVRLAPWHDDRNLGCWMRLTSLVTEWQHLRRY